MTISTIGLAVPGPPPGEGPEWGKAAPIGLLIILLLGAAFWLLMRSMNKHLRKVNSTTEVTTAESAAIAADAVDGDPEPDDPSTSDDASSVSGRPAVGGEQSADDRIDLVKHPGETDR